MKKRHILVVDDDKYYSHVLVEHLSGLGFRVSLAENCKTSLEILQRKETVDVMILDYILPDGTGTELLQKITKNDKLQKPPVILASGIAQRQNSAWETFLPHLPSASQTLVQACMQKPYGLDNMETVLELVFDSTRAATPANTVTTGDYPDVSPRHKPH